MWYGYSNQSKLLPIWFVQPECISLLTPLAAGPLLKWQNRSMSLRNVNGFQGTAALWNVWKETFKVKNFVNMRQNNWSSDSVISNYREVLKDHLSVKLKFAVQFLCRINVQNSYGNCSFVYWRSPILCNLPRRRTDSVACECLQPKFSSITSCQTVQYIDQEALEFDVLLFKDWQFRRTQDPDKRI